MRRALVFLVLISCGKKAPPVVTTERDKLAVTIVATAPGASPQEMARTVATPIEHAIGAVPGLTAIHSRSSEGATAIVVDFPAGTDGYTAAEKVSAAVSAILKDLPPAMSPPLVTRAAQRGAVMRVVLRSPALSAVEMTATATHVSDKIQELAGVNRVDMCGTVHPVRTVRIDPVALASRGKSLTDVVADVRAWAAMPQSGDFPTDIATVDSATAPPACVAVDATERFIALTVTSQSGADPIEVREALETKIAPQLAALVPASVRVEVWPRTKPLVFDVRFPPGTPRANQLASLQKALPHGANVLAELGMTSARALDPDAADVRIVTSEGDKIRADLVAQGLTIFDPSDHVVGIAGVDPAALQAHATALAQALDRTPGLHVIERRGMAETTTLSFEIDRAAAARLAVSASEISNALAVLVPGGVEVGTLAASEHVPVVVTVTGELPELLEQIHLGGAPLSMFVKTTRTPEPAVVFHENQVPWLGLRISGPLDALDAALAKVPIPAGTKREVREPD